MGIWCRITNLSCKVGVDKFIYWAFGSQEMRRMLTAPTGCPGAQNHGRMAWCLYRAGCCIKALLMWLKLCATLAHPPFLCQAAERKLNELSKPSRLRQPFPHQVSVERPLLPGVISIALQLFQELSHADSSPSSATHPISALREGFLRRVIEQLYRKEKKRKKKPQPKSTALLYEQILWKHGKEDGSAGNIA